LCKSVLFDMFSGCFKSASSPKRIGLKDTASVERV